MKDAAAINSRWLLRKSENAIFASFCYVYNFSCGTLGAASKAPRHQNGIAFGIFESGFAFFLGKCSQA